MEINEAKEALIELRTLIDLTVNHIETGGEFTLDKYAEHMAYDIILGSRFGITDLKKKERK